jgi:hypothetical protein
MAVVRVKFQRSRKMHAILQFSCNSSSPGVANSNFFKAAGFNDYLPIVLPPETKYAPRDDPTCDPSGHSAYRQSLSIA